MFFPHLLHTDIYDKSIYFLRYSIDQTYFIFVVCQRYAIEGLQNINAKCGLFELLYCCDVAVLKTT
jgi:hypothetical protein